MQTKRGEVVRVLFPNSNLQTSKRRPALVVQANQLQTGIAQTILAMISSNLSRAGHPSRMVILAASAEGRKAGLRLDSVIMTDNLMTVSDTDIDSVLGKLPQHTMAAIDDALRHTLNL